MMGCNMRACSSMAYQPELIDKFHRSFGLYPLVRVLQAELDSMSTSQASPVADQRLRSETVWGAALVCVADSLHEGRRHLWDEAARRVATLLAAPGAFQGEHFLQVNLEVLLYHSDSSASHSSITDLVQ